MAGKRERDTRTHKRRYSTIERQTQGSISCTRTAELGDTRAHLSIHLPVHAHHTSFCCGAQRDLARALLEPPSRVACNSAIPPVVLAPCPQVSIFSRGTPRALIHPASPAHRASSSCRGAPAPSSQNPPGSQPLRTRYKILAAAPACLPAALLRPLRRSERSMRHACLPARLFPSNPSSSPSRTHPKLACSAASAMHPPLAARSPCLALACSSAHAAPPRRSCLPACASQARPSQPRRLSLERLRRACSLYAVGQERGPSGSECRRALCLAIVATVQAEAGGGGLLRSKGALLVSLSRLPVLAAFTHLLVALCLLACLLSMSLLPACAPFADGLFSRALSGAAAPLCATALCGPPQRDGREVPRERGPH